MPDDGHEDTTPKLFSMQKYASSAIVFFPEFGLGFLLFLSPNYLTGRTLPHQSDKQERIIHNCCKACIRNLLRTKSSARIASAVQYLASVPLVNHNPISDAQGVYTMINVVKFAFIY